jgi:uncharacterized protein YlxP (DUF503 family)
MFVGVLQVDFVLRGSHSLKDRRRILRSIKDRAAHRFNVSIAEVGDVEMWQRASLGISLVGREHHFVETSLQEVLRFLRGARDAEIVGHQIDIL